MAQTPEAVVFDIGNVLVQWDPRHLYRKIFAVEAEMEAFLAGICTMDWHMEHDRGVSFAENAALLKARHPDSAALIDLRGARYGEMAPDRVPGVAPLVEELAAAGIPLYGLSNMPHGFLAELTARFPELGHLGTTVVSAELGVLKPDPAVYLALIERTGLRPEATLFIDDSAKNVEAARQLGFHTHHFAGAEGLRAALQAAGFAVPA